MSAAAVVALAALPVPSKVDRAWQVLDGVLDPEVPVVSVCDLGIVRDVTEQGGAIEVVVTPTYSGCPATEVIERSIVDALEAEGLGPAHVRMQRAPAWTTDWMSDAGRRKLHGYGIAPPGPVPTTQGVPIRFVGRAPRDGAGVSALREPRHRTHQRLRRHGVQGALALQGLRRALRTLQADLMVPPRSRRSLPPRGRGRAWGGPAPGRG